jgi:hypothetical protein
MKQIFLVISSMLSSSVIAQDMTKGLIMPDPDVAFKSCCLYIPTSGLVAYDRPNGKEIANLEPGAPDNNGEVYKAFIKSDQGLTEFSYANLYMVGYEVMAIVYIDKQGEFVKTNNRYWLSVKELKSKGLILTTWMEYLINAKDVLGWYANDPGLNLRAEPTTNAEILATLKGDLWEITPTSETKGLWCKVTVKEYRKHPCSGGKDLVIQTLTDWVKLLSDEQTPNVWDYGKGC